MVNTNFRNSNGLPDPAQISTARDMAILCRALIKRFPQYYHYFSVREFTYNGIPHANHNHLMSRYEGMDGLKTGLTNASGFNLAASAVRGGRRLIGVVFGGISAVQRDDYMASLLDDGFQKVGGVAMTTAAPPPVPVHKPADLAGGGPSQAPAPTTVADARPIAQVDPGAGPTTAAGIANSVDTAPVPLPTTTTTTSSGIRLNAPRPTTIGALAAISGQGDAEDGADIAPAPRSKRTQKTPPQKLAMATPAKPTAAAARSSKSPKAEPAGWSIQVGAYATRQATEQAIKQAIKRAPDVLKHATPVVTTLQQKHGTLYRARLAGLEAGEAKKACKAIARCITVAPGA
jgi:D-alanyl-D-alanine carboxypeptidase